MPFLIPFALPLPLPLPTLPTTPTRFTVSSSSPNSPFSFSWQINFCQIFIPSRNILSKPNSVLRRIHAVVETTTDPDPIRTPITTMGVPEMRNNTAANNNNQMAMVFTYGTLKRGFSNHALMQDLIATRDAVFLGACRTADRIPLVCGPYRVPFLLNKPGAGERVWGELYAVSRKGLVKMDELEGTSRGHYERLPIRLVSAEEEEEEAVVEAEAYFGHRTYAEEMWRRSGERGYAIYSEKEAKGYVKRKDRPQNLTFLDHIRIFLASPSPSPPV